MIEGIDSVRLLAAHFGRIPAELQAQLRPKLLEAARLVQVQAQANASWSTRIPGAISASSSLTGNGGAVVRVSAAKAPHARPYEGMDSRRGFFRHPVYGTGTWVEQKTRPFLVPALESVGEQAKKLIADAVTATLKR